MAIQAIIFDLFDTLIYIEPSILDSELDKMAAIAGVSPEVFRNNWAPKSAVHRQQYFKGQLDSPAYFTAVLTNMGKEASPAIVNNISKIRLAMREHVRLFDDTIPVLEQLKAKGYTLGMISNLGSLWGRFIEKLPITDYFQVITLSYEIGMAKPEPEIYLTTAEKMGCAPAQCAFIDDQPDYVLAAEQVGMTGFWLNRIGKNNGYTHRQLVSLQEIILNLHSQ